MARRLAIRSAASAFSLLAVAFATATRVQAQAPPPPLGSLALFGVLGSSTVTNTGASTITGTPAQPGDLGISPGNSFANVGIMTFSTGGVTHLGDATATSAQIDLTTVYNNLMGRTATANLTGQNLGGLTLVPGVYNFNSSAQLTGALTLNGLGNPNAVFIFNIGSALTTASASSVVLINGAQGGNVFWRIGSSATLGTTTAFSGDILAQASITLNTGADITCGAAWARSGAVTLDTDTITLCNLLAASGALAPGGVAPGGAVLGPTGVPLFASLLPPSASANQRAVATGLDNFVSGGGALPLGFLNLFNLSPSDLANALTQISGEAGTGAAQAGTQAMNSFLSLVSNPFDNSRPFAEIPPPPPYVKALPAKAKARAFGAVPEARRWSVWAAGYGGQSTANGDPFAVGSHNRSVGTFGYVTGLDYLLTPNTVVGFALGGGGTQYGLSDGLGGGRSDMAEAAVYSTTRINAAYVSAALAYGWNRFSTDRAVTVAGFDQLTANFSANDVGGRIEGGYRFAIPDLDHVRGRFGVTPYAAAQVQAFWTPAYSETAVSGQPTFALAYDAHTTTTARTELGAWLDWSTLVESGTTLVLRTRAAWAHDTWSQPSMTASFVALPGSSFTVTGAAPASDLMLASAAAEIWFAKNFSVGTRFDGEFAPSATRYAGTGWVRYTF
jgi:uncharacterized protein with beta-barrel porin domain